MSKLIFQAVQFGISSLVLFVASTPDQSEPGSDGNEGVLRIP